MAVAAQRRPQRGGFRRGRLGEHPGQVGGLLAGRGLGDHLGGSFADAGKGLQGAVADPLLQLARWQVANDLGGPAERPHPVGRLGGPLQLERDLPQRVDCLHTQQIPVRVVSTGGRCRGRGRTESYPGRGCWHRGKAVRRVAPAADRTPRPGQPTARRCG